MLALALTTCACGADVTTYRAPNYAPRRVTLSVLGVFKNGRMDAAAWNDWAPTIADATGDETCTAAFDDRMEKAAPALFNELDESTRQDGVTDEILDRVAPSALGNAIMILEVFGRPTPMKKAEDVEASPQQAPPASAPLSGRGRGRGRLGGANQSAARNGPPTDALEVSIGVYSIRDQQVIASVQMHPDAGESADALQKLSEKLRETLHGAKCAGWIWQSREVAK
ncbi:MAG TPA: hypothetical protein VHC69_09805 [Polyangiaceae bacterium]|nr:hypothetical protein [Polyangiaceae bacterium]